MFETTSLYQDHQPEQSIAINKTRRQNLPPGLLVIYFESLL